MLTTPISSSEKNPHLEILALKCEYLTKPINIDVKKPRFSWILGSAERGQSQTAYQIFVSSDENKFGDMWNSGRINSSETSQIMYEGKDLKSNSKYFWKVISWDNCGIKIESEKTYFWTAILDSSKWIADWIGAGPHQEYFPAKGFYTSYKEQYDLQDTVRHDGQSLLIRNEFRSNNKISNARVFVIGLGFYELYLNGFKVGDHLLAPAKTNYREELLYDTYNVKNLIKDGENAVGIHLGNGWFNPYKKWWRPYRMQWFGAKRALLQLEIEYEDGTTSIVRTSEEWKTSPGPITYNCIYDGEHYDANLEKTGWANPGFDDTDWESAVRMKSPSGKLISHVMPAIKITERINPVNIYYPSPDTVIFDMGQNFAGVVKLTLKGSKGTKVKLNFAEDIKFGGRLDPTSNEHASAKAEYILKGEYTEIYQPRFTYYGFQYVEISSDDQMPEIMNIEGLVTHTAIEQTGYFECSNPTLNKIHNATLWSQRSNIIGYPMDCPQRDERLGWFGDVQVTIEEAMYNFDTPQFYKNWLSGIKSNQEKKTGDIPIISPRPYIYDEGVEWSSTYIILVWKYYTYFGDKQILADHYNSMKRYMVFLDSISNNYILKKGWIGDWGSLVEGWEEGEPESVPTAFYFWNSKILSKVAEILVREKDRQYFKDLALKIKEQYNKKYYNPVSKNYNDGSQMANAFPLYLGLVPESHENYVLVNLVDDILNKNNGHLTTGVLGSKYMIDALTKYGREDIAYLLATQEGYPSWSDMVEKYNTMCEFWTLKQSHNHIMTGSIDAFFYKTLAGINFISEYPGAKFLRINPYFPDNMEYVKSSIETIKGKVGSSWRKSEGGINLNIIIPVNVTAEIIIPESDLSKVCEGGVVIKDNKDVQILSADSINSKFIIRSGNYEFFIAK